MPESLINVAVQIPVVLVFSYVLIYLVRLFNERLAENAKEERLSREKSQDIFLAEVRMERASREHMEEAIMVELRALREEIHALREELNPSSGINPITRPRKAN